MEIKLQQAFLSNVLPTGGEPPSHPSTESTSGLIRLTPIKMGTDMLCTELITMINYKKSFNIPKDICIL